MIAAQAVEKQSWGVLQTTPHLSYSRISKYLHCPEQYRLYYVENLRPKVLDASLAFGKAVHAALEGLFRHGVDPGEGFRKRWGEFRCVQLSYKERESWDKLLATGTALIEKFVREELPRISNVRAIERPFTLSITTLSLPIVGVIDLVAELDGQETVIDFKTAASSYQTHEAALSDQLTAYQLAEPAIARIAFCVFVKTKEPKIQWNTNQRGAIALTEFVDKVAYVSGEIAARHFYKRTGKWCGYCDYLPVCVGDETTVRKALAVFAAHQ